MPLDPQSKCVFTSTQNICAVCSDIVLSQFECSVFVIAFYFNGCIPGKWEILFVVCL